MIGEVIHIGVTVSDMERSIKFYRDILGLKFTGELYMEGESTDLLFGSKGTKAKVVYFNSGENISGPPVELIQFIGEDVIRDRADLKKTSISEICFKVDDIEKAYKHLVDNGVECLSAPQEFDFRDINMGLSKAIYFRDPDGIILELIEYLN